MGNKAVGLRAFVLFNLCAEFLNFALFALDCLIFHYRPVMGYMSLSLLLSAGTALQVIITAAAYFRLKKFFAGTLPFHGTVWLCCGALLTAAAFMVMPRGGSSLEGTEFFVFSILFHAGLLLAVTVFCGIRYLVRKA
ncbi:hypothetical protein [Ruminococcus sp.]|uniref:hypothetical protein n=1 Tax=Ruminococcus sp. TaxID=41978 RepID=UPI0025DE4234|nr:hypothetical protein [Ruminococcus sp.]MBQ8966198.1 hypothetical protein [Ruminococcus sp.]